MKSTILFIAAVLISSTTQMRVIQKDLTDGNPIPICYGGNDGKCVTVEHVLTPNRFEHGYNTEFEWETNRCSDC